jgi:WD40 repeat protein
VVTASIDDTARVWDARTGQPVTGPLEHGNIVTSAAFSADGTRVVTASYDKTARVWDARTGQPVLSGPLEHKGTVHTAVFSADGTRVVTASDDRTAVIWVLPIDLGSREDWQLRARCGPFKLENGALIDNDTGCP